MIRARVGILGVGNRGATAYGRYMLRRPDLAEVVAMADPRQDRLAAAAADHGVAEAHLYADWKTLLRREDGLDAVIIALPDRLHHQAAMLAMRQGVAILLEKPIGNSQAEIRALRAAARRWGADVTVAHVLRYTPFFARIRDLLQRGAIGTLQTVRHTEQIGYWHFAHSYVRGNWRRAEEASPMILSKACHDLDILRWLVDSPCTHVDSVGRLGHFTREHAPEGSTERCDQGCAVERSCPYSAPRIYLERLPPADAWPHDVVSLDTSAAGIAAALHTGPYGRCVYRCDNDVMDHQSVSLRFANGVTATLNVSAFTEKSTRTVHLMGSHGEIFGDFEAGTITVGDFRINDTRTSSLALPPDAVHGGGDDQLMADFLGRVLDRKRRGNSPDALTSLEESLESHDMAFAAERSRRAGERVVLARRRTVADAG
ncbi:MAG: Gfo/Idh/MocA family oxidoreductase [Acetobacteraceae bacterium]|nr:Gfo/Idh/MocA family oxidoreductase [Acetobacteraceae bacterium]